ncbi:hypothetical protein QAD02_011073 [Eretmocerus hayati]|uniref:Uncharacterized protein n=1 Tax=Eretmocerus hayati TaxID=131215 RepID=A0ACC2NW05_9HYME|nr:hypothetical protein QAD02_011073 [Eretmocerus hayati]
MSDQAQKPVKDLSFVIDSTPDKDDDELSILDVLDFDDSAHDRWLCSPGDLPKRNSIDGKVEDLDAWLHAAIMESEAAQGDSSSKRCVDTRTFTRIKRRSNRMSLDALGAAASSELMPPPSSNVWRNSVIPESPVQEPNTLRDSLQKKDNIPMMLRPKSNQVLSALLSDSPASISSQTSMEAFMNISRTKEGMSSLMSNSSEPDVNSILMNISQPSLLYSSIISDGRGDESVQVAPATDSLTDSQILTDSMMDASIFKDMQDTNELTEFLKQSSDFTCLENGILSKNSDAFDINEKTVISEGSVSDKTYTSIGDKNSKSADETFVAEEDPKLNGTFTRNEESDLDETFTSIPSPIAKTETQNHINKSLYDSSDYNGNSSSSSSFKSFPSSPTKTEYYDAKPLSSQESSLVQCTVTSNSMNSTKTISSENERSTSSRNGEDVFVHDIIDENKCETKPDVQTSSPTLKKEQLKTIYQATDPTINDATRKSRTSGNRFDSTFTAESPHPLGSELNVTYDPTSITKSSSGNKLHNATFVQESQCHQIETLQEEQNLDATYDCVENNPNTIAEQNPRQTGRNLNRFQTQTLDQSRFNTFRKDNKTGHRWSQVPQTQIQPTKTGIAPPAKSQISNRRSCAVPSQQKFNTFTRRSVAVAKSVVDENKPDNKFVKPSGQLSTGFAKPGQPPRQLSKLPQLFQKSHPNLGSKTLGKLKVESQIGFHKGSQPDISNNTYSLGRFKSEQRLLQMKHISQFSSIDNTSRSMESIDSTASAHSAPDFDDGLSIGSDGSRASYTIKPNNREISHTLATEEIVLGKSFGVSTPGIKGRHILENTWVKENDLPSPISKNGIGKGHDNERNTSPSEDADFNARTSSPLTASPTGSDQAIHSHGGDNGFISTIKKEKAQMENVKVKQLKPPSSVPNTMTKLRQPTNWAGGPNKTGGGSGIPRPASRIPPPKFTKSNLK